MRRVRPKTVMAREQCPRIARRERGYSQRPQARRQWFDQNYQLADTLFRVACHRNQQIYAVRGGGGAYSAYTRNSTSRPAHGLIIKPWQSNELYEDGMPRRRDRGQPPPSLYPR